MEGIAHSEGYGDASLKPPVETQSSANGDGGQQYPWNGYGYVYPQPGFPAQPTDPNIAMVYPQYDPAMTNYMKYPPFDPAMGGQMQQTQDPGQGMYPQGFWDQNGYWWGMGMPEMVYPESGMQDSQDVPPPVTAEEPSQP